MFSCSRDPVVSLVSKESKENVASVESLELKAPKVIAVSLVYKVFPAHSYESFTVSFVFLEHYSDEFLFHSKN